ncbi:MAG: DUF4097 family beta strand repeat-containing protein [Steroidobacteraceae bacterium]
MSIRIALLTAATLMVFAQPAAAEQVLSKRATVVPDATINVSNVQGSVDVSAWDRNEVELDARLESDKDELKFEATDRLVRIAVDRPDKKFGRADDEEAILTLRVPKSARLIVDTVSADIEVSGVRGDQRLESVSGDVTTQAFDTRVDLQSVSGDVTIAGNGGKALVSTENVSGSTVASGIRGGYEGAAVSGDITATVADAERLRVGSVSGNVEVHADLTSTARVEMESISGTVALTLKPPVNADFEIESFSGDIENCFGPKAQDNSKYTPGSELNFTQGSGGARVEMQTLSGDISLCDR